MDVKKVYVVVPHAEAREPPNLKHLRSCGTQAPASYLFCFFSVMSHGSVGNPDASRRVTKLIKGSDGTYSQEEIVIMSHKHA